MKNIESIRREVIPDFDIARGIINVEIFDKFAELIVKECLDIIDGVDDKYEAYRMIKERFGV